MALDSSTFAAQYGFDKPPLDSAVVFHCLMGGRAQKAVDGAKAAGYAKAVAYPGSFKDWQAKGGKVESG